MYLYFSKYAINLTNNGYIWIFWVLVLWLFIELQIKSFYRLWSRCSYHYAATPLGFWPRFVMDFFSFLNVGPPKESIFLTTFYGLYFSHQYTNITNYISSCYSISTTCQSAEYILEFYIRIQIWTIQLLIFLSFNHLFGPLTFTNAKL